MRLSRHIQSLLQRAEVLVQEQQQAAQGGVLALPADEFAQARKTLPVAGPNEIGVLLVLQPLSTAEWIERHSPQPPVTEPREVTE